MKLPIKPMLCEARDEPFNDENYIWETKFDGVRAIVEVNKGVRIWSRAGNERTHQFPELDIRTKVSAVLDGEIVCYQPDGKLEFNGIQHRNRQNGVELAARQYPATLEVFDILEADGIDLTRLPLMKRKAMLDAVLIPTNNVRTSPYVDDGIKLLKQIEWNANTSEKGVVAKRKDQSYQQNARAWIKVKVHKWGEFVIVGYTDGTGWRASTFGALVLAESDSSGNLSYVGSVGTGFNDAEISRIYQRLLSEKRQGYCPFSPLPSDIRDAHFIYPGIAVKIRYLDKTKDGKLRFPSYKGMTS